MNEREKEREAAEGNIFRQRQNINSGCCLFCQAVSQLHSTHTYPPDEEQLTQRIVSGSHPVGSRGEGRSRRDRCVSHRSSTENFEVERKLRERDRNDRHRREQRREQQREPNPKPCERKNLDGYVFFSRQVGKQTKASQTGL